jgi:membrane protease YdiL (CAAX protease family)
MPEICGMNLAAISIICVGLGYLVYLYVPVLPAIQKRLHDADGEPTSGETRMILFQRILGSFLFGFIPFILITFSGNNLESFGMNGQHAWSTLAASLVLSLLLVSLNFFHRENPENLARYPQIRNRTWSISLLLASALSWMMYLFCYEFLFRGFLLFSLVHVYGKTLAVVVNVTLYALVHVVKGWKESIGAIPLGILLCYICLYTGNFWTAFLVHCSLALSNEWFSLAIHPDMFLERRKKTPV